MKFYWFLGSLFLVTGIIFWQVKSENKTLIDAKNIDNNIVENSNVEDVKKEKNIGYFSKYNFDNLKIRGGVGSEIKEIGKVLVVEEARKEVLKKYEEKGIIKKNNFESKAIQFESNGKKISGMMNIPITPMSNKIPTIIMLRGYAESEGYFIGSGSWKVADELARNGFVTVSLDFLGYGLSDNESTDILEARFEKAVSVLDLIESVKKIDIVDENKIGIWSHSNGGQIAMSILEITSANYPTVMWAPMTKPFPESIVSTMDESEAGKIVKAKIEEFKKDYDVELYSINNFYDRVRAPILIHQGTEDEWCKVEWQKEVLRKLKSFGQEVVLEIEDGNDHNLKQNWDEIVEKDIRFYKNKFQL